MYKTLKTFSALILQITSENICIIASLLFFHFSTNFLKVHASNLIKLNKSYYSSPFFFALSKMVLWKNDFKISLQNIIVWI